MGTEYLLKALHEMIEREMNRRAVRYQSVEQDEESYREICDEIVDYIKDKALRYQE